MYLKLDMFLLLSRLCLFFFWWGVELEIWFSAYFSLDILVGLTLFHLNKKRRKWADTDIFRVKTWMISHKTQHFHTNCNDLILQIDVTLKSFLSMQFFNYCLSQLFPWNVLWSSQSSITWQWLLFHSIKTREKYKQVIKFRYYLIITSQTNIGTKWCFCRFHLKLLFRT